MNMAKRKRRPLSYERRKSRAGMTFILPWIIGAAVFFVLPVFQSIQLSFGKYTLTDNGYNLSWIGLSNYVKLFVEDAHYSQKLIGSLRNTLLQTPVIVIFSLFIALLLNQKFRGRMLARGIYFLPVIIAGGVVYTIVSGQNTAALTKSISGGAQLFQSGFVFDVLTEMGITNFTLMDYIVEFVNDLFQMIWRTGIQQLIFLAGLQNIPASMYEVATIEGATGWERFWKVTFPLVSPMLLINTIYTIVDSFTLVDRFSNENTTLMGHIFMATQNLRLESAAAMTWVYFLIVLAVMGVVYRLINRKVYYEV